MLNRMMFVYFVQKQGFLDGDPDYLRNRLRTVQRQSGGVASSSSIASSYCGCSTRAWGSPEAQRAPDLAALLGKVPFLNGGLFDVHDLERDNPDISIPDEAFQRVFDFFDGYRWHLDERPYREDNEINPDVLGYIFEKYVNQKQMGAYYTKEDITGYISRNTVIPFLFDAARKECPVAFGPDGGVWRLLRDDPTATSTPLSATASCGTCGRLRPQLVWTLPSSAGRDRRRRRRRVQARRLEPPRALRLRPAHGDLARGGGPPPTLLRGP